MAANEAFVSLIEAPMGGGKSVTSTAFVIDDYFKNIQYIESKSGQRISVFPYNLNYVRIKPKQPDVLEKYWNQIIKIPDDYRPYSTTKIFCNYHLFGIQYCYAPMRKVLSFVNTPILRHAKWIIDESYMELESRRGMNPMTIFVTEYAQSMRKLDVELYVLIQHGRFIDWRIRYITKRKILTSYNDKTHMVKLLIQDLKKGTEKSLRYYSVPYWQFYDTNELPMMPTAMVERARKWA